MKELVCRSEVLKKLIEGMNFMKSLFKHSLKLTFANFLGILTYLILSFLLNIGFYALVILILLGTAGGLGLMAGGIWFDLETIVSTAQIAFVPILFCFFIYLLLSILLQSMLMGGLYGSVIESVYENRSSVGVYFKYSFRNLWRLTGLQLVIYLLGIPVYLGVFFVNQLFTSLFSENLSFIPVVFSVVVGLLFMAIFLHTPIFIIKLRSKILRSIGLTFQLLKENFSGVLLSGLKFYGVLILICGLYVAIILIPSIIGDVVLEKILAEDLSMALSSIYIFIAFFVGIFGILPFSITSALLMLVQNYRSHFHELVEPSGDSEKLEQRDPIFQWKS